MNNLENSITKAVTQRACLPSSRVLASLPLAARLPKSSIKAEVGDDLLQLTLSNDGYLDLYTVIRTLLCIGRHGRRD